MKAQVFESSYLYDVRNYVKKVNHQASAVSPDHKLKIETSASPGVYPFAGGSDSEALMHVVHEIRNPLTNINLSLACLSSEILNPDITSHLEIISRSTRRISDLVTSLLKTPNNNASPETSDMNAILAETLLLSNDRANLKKIAVETEFCPQPCMVAVHKQEFIMALSNIIINAIEAVGPEIGKLRIETRMKENHCFVSILDNGIGISKEDLDQIFSPHFTRKHAGTGIGLAVTKQVLTNHNAIMHVASSPGKGTCFTIIMALAAVETRFDES